MGNYYQTALMSADASQSLSKVVVQNIWNKQRAALDDKHVVAADMRKHGQHSERAQRVV